MVRAYLLEIVVFSPVCYRFDTDTAVQTEYLVTVRYALNGHCSVICAEPLTLRRSGLERTIGITEEIYVEEFEENMAILTASWTTRRFVGTTAKHNKWNYVYAEASNRYQIPGDHRKKIPGPDVSRILKTLYHKYFIENSTPRSIKRRMSRISRRWKRRTWPAGRADSQFGRDAICGGTCTHRQPDSSYAVYGGAQLIKL